MQKSFFPHISVYLTVHFNSKNTKIVQASILCLILFFFQLIYFFQFRFAYNEMDVIPYAKAVYTPSFLPNDWYLHTQIAYRYLFSFPLGFLAEKGGLVFALIVGRLISYAFLSVAITRLIFNLKATQNELIYLLASLLFFSFFPAGMGAGEWMIGGLETKVFAYGFVLLSLSSALKKEKTWTLIFAALALDFHLLIGIYHLFALLPIFYLQRQKNEKTRRKTVENIGLFLFIGSFGIYGIFQGIIDNQETGQEAWKIYVQLRVPFHTLPSVFPSTFWIKLILFSGIQLLIFTQTKREKLRFLSSYALFTSLICVVGLLVFSFSDIGNLRFYFFRFSDALLPLLTLFASSAFFFEKQPVFLPSKQGLWKLVLSLSILFMCTPQLLHFVQEWQKSGTTLLENAGPDPALGKWISKHTPQTAVFLIPPDNSFFYIQSERAQFVSWKHFPQDKKSILEWQRRLKLINRGNEFHNLNEVQFSYNQLTSEDIRQMAKKETFSYVVMPKTNRLDLPVVKVSKENILYRID